MQTQNKNIHLKISFENQLRRAALENLTFKALEALIRELFSLPNEKLSLRYKDEEEDLITLETDVELETALYSLPPNRPLRLFVTLVAPITPPPSIHKMPSPFVDQPKSQCMKHHFKRMKFENPEQSKQIKQAFKLKKQAHKEQKRQEKAQFIAQYNATFSPDSVILPNVPSFQQSVSLTITNTGSAPWPLGTSFVSVGKCKTNGSKIVFSSSIAPDGFVVITLDVTVSDQGCYFSKWRLLLPNNVKFGDKFWIKTKHFSPRGHCRVDEFQKKKKCEGIMQLKEMGFQGRKLWCLMKKYDGDVDRVLADLLSDKEHAEKAE